MHHSQDPKIYLSSVNEKQKKPLLNKKINEAVHATG